jgi:hypothetical protein
MKKRNGTLAQLPQIIRMIRGQKVILDMDLAAIYRVPTKRLNEQVKRNLRRFPTDFLFRLERAEAEDVLRSRSQSATLKRGANLKHLPFAFTENGAIMAATVLNSAEAIRMSVFVVRAFVGMRETLSATTELADQLRLLESKLTARLDSHETAIVEILQRIMEIINPPPAPPEPLKPEIGFHAAPRAKPLARGRS